MKPQDVGFIVVFVTLIILRKPRYFIYTGLTCLLLAIPLFSRWIFFTGERLVWYAAAFFFLGIIKSI